VTGDFYVTGVDASGNRVIADATYALLQSIDLTVLGADNANAHSGAVDPLNGDISCRSEVRPEQTSIASARVAASLCSRRQSRQLADARRRVGRVDGTPSVSAFNLARAAVAKAVGGQRYAAFQPAVSMSATKEAPKSINARADARQRDEASFG
jgi:hypothetical protein